MTTSRANFYDSIHVEEETDTVHPDTLTLQSYVAIFPPGTGLVIGKVVRMMCSFKASSSFPLLKIDRKVSKKQMGCTELCALTHEENRKMGCDDADIPRNYKESKEYIWCNYRECISPVTVTIDDEGTIILSETDL